MNRRTLTNIAATRPRTGAARGFTLMEMVTSCIILSLLMLSIGYGLKLALVSTGNGAAQSTASLEAGDVVERITDDMNEAIDFSEKTANAVTFTVPDRDGDAAKISETVRYQWWPTAGTYTIPASGGGGGGGLVGGLLGTVGGLLGGGTSDGSGGTVITIPQYALTRQVGQNLDPLGPPAVVARDVRQFGLGYLYRNMAAPPVPVSTERLLLPASEPLGLSYTERSIVFNPSAGAVGLAGMTFQPSQHLPAGTTSMTITRVQFYLRTDSTLDGVLFATIRNTAAGLPSVTTSMGGGQIAGATSRWVPEAGLAAVGVSTLFPEEVGWVDFAFPTPVTLTVGSTTRYCVVLQAVNGATGNAAVASLLGGTTPLMGTVYATWNGSAWQNGNPSYLRYRIYGTSN